VFHHAYDFDLFLQPDEPLANRAFVREVMTRGGLIDHRHWLGVLVVSEVEVAALQERRSHRLEELWRDIPCIDAAVRLRQRRRSLDGDAADTRFSAAEDLEGETCRTRAGQGIDPFEQLPVQISERPFAATHVNSRDQDLLAVEPGVLVLQISQGADEEAGADEQYQGEGDLR